MCLIRLHLGFSVRKTLRVHGVEYATSFPLLSYYVASFYLSYHSAYGVYGALWHIGRKRVRYDNDGVFNFFPAAICIGYEGEG